MKVGACSACRARKVRCDVLPGANTCQRCEASGQGATCILETSRTRSVRSTSTPPVDHQAIPTGSRQKRSDSTCSLGSTGVVLPEPKKQRTSKSQDGKKPMLFRQNSNSQELDIVYEDDNEYIVSLVSVSTRAIINLIPISCQQTTEDVNEFASIISAGGGLEEPEMIDYDIDLDTEDNNGGNTDGSSVERFSSLERDITPAVDNPRPTKKPQQRQRTGKVQSADNLLAKYDPETCGKKF